MINFTPWWQRWCIMAGSGQRRPVVRPKLTTKRLAGAIGTTLNTPAMQQRASDLAAILNAEDGVSTAISLINAHLKTE